MNGINWKIIPHSEQRYPTAGDYWLDKDGVWQIRVSKLSDWRYEFLIFFHEALELAWCIWKGIPEPDVKAFDEEYERNRKPGDIDSEPGNDKRAPYFEGHQYATICERIAAIVLGVNWSEYDNEVSHL